MSQFIEYLHEAFHAFGRLETKRMFSGYGVYHQGLTIALVIGDTLYLKADELTVPLFEKEGQRRFEYTRQGKTAHLSYYTAPADVLESREAAALWGRRAYEAALRAQAKAPKPRRPSADKVTAKKKVAAKKTAAKKTAARKTSTAK